VLIAAAFAACAGGVFGTPRFVDPSAQFQK
jgi:hypothetical protein